MPQNFSDFVATILHGSDFCGDKEETSAHCQNVQDNTLHRGDYATHLKRWKDAFGPNLLVIDSTADQEENTRRVLKHAGLPEAEYRFPRKRIQKEREGHKRNGPDHNGCV